MKNFFVGVLSVLCLLLSACGASNVNSSSVMKFSQPVKLGELTLPPMGYFDLSKATENQGTLCHEKAYEHLNLYEKGTARFGDGDDALYFHYDATQRIKNLVTGYDELLSKFGSQDINNTVQVLPGIPTIVWLLKTNSDITFYILEHGSAAGFGSSSTVIGKKSDGTFVKYFETHTLKKKYFGRKSRGMSDEWNTFSFQDNTIIIRHGKYGNRNFVPEGEFRFKWNEQTQTFDFERSIYDSTAVMNFSQPFYIGHAGGRPYAGQSSRFKGGYFIEEATYNDGNIIMDAEDDRNKTYGKGLARWGDGSDAIWCKYDVDTPPDSKKFVYGLSFGGKDNYILSEYGWRDIYKIETLGDMTFYLLEHRYKRFVSIDVLGCSKDGTWDKYIDLRDVEEQYFGKSATRGTEIIWTSEEWKHGLEGVSCDGDTITIQYHVFAFKPSYHKVEDGEFRFTWDNNTHKFSVDRVAH